MMLFFLILLGVFAAIVGYLVRESGRQQKQFAERMQLLQQTISELHRESLVQDRKLQLNAELEKTLRVSKPKLGQLIFNLNFDLFELLSKHQLLGPEK